MNKTQFQTILAPVVGVIAAWLASKIPFIDAATWGVWINGAILAIVSGVMAWLTGNNAVIAQAAALPEVKTVITDSKTANTGPLASVNNVVSG